MFIEFDKYFNVNIENNIRESKDALTTFRSKYQGMSFGDGIYRVFRGDAIEKWEEIISEGYPDFKSNFEPFAYDWLGRCFAVDLRKDSQGQILMFEIGTADVLHIPCNFTEFHEEEIPLSHDACLASNFFNEWRDANGVSLQPDQCVGYKIPLFLGGIDTVDNLEVSDMEVYWYICSAAKNKK